MIKVCAHVCAGALPNTPSVKSELQLALRTLTPKASGEIFAICFSHSCDVLAIEDAESLLQRLDLFLSAGNTILVADTSINTRGLQLLIVCQSSVKLLLRAIEVCLLLLKRLLLVLLLARLVLNVLGLLRLVH